MADEPQKPTHTLEDFSKEEADQIDEEIKAILTKYSAHLHINRTIDIEGKIQAAVKIFKMVPIAEESIPSPIQAEDLKDNAGTNSTEESEAQPDAKAA